MYFSQRLPLKKQNLHENSKKKPQNSRKFAQYVYVTQKQKTTGLDRLGI